MDYKSGFNGGYKKDAGRKKEVRTKKTVRHRRGGIVLAYPASNTLCEPRPNSSQLYSSQNRDKKVKVGKKKLERTPAEEECHAGNMSDTSSSRPETGDSRRRRRSSSPIYLLHVCFIALNCTRRDLATHCGCDRPQIEDVGGANSAKRRRGGTH